MNTIRKGLATAALALLALEFVGLASILTASLWVTLR
jgi:hypothetical protein